MSIQIDELSVGARHRRSLDPRVESRDVDCALPIVIGVTGHRRLDASWVQPLESAVVNIFADVRREYPSSPLIVLSPLAEGADRLVARVGLAAGARLVVPLPFDTEHYRRDFVDSHSQAEFDELVGRATRHFVLPLLEGHAAESTSGRGLGRDLHYAQVGAYIARTSQVLIALWDGDTRVLKGGTADVVNFRLHGAPPELVPVGAMLDAPLSGPLYHIATPSPTTPVPEQEPFSVRTMYPSGYASDSDAAASFAAKLESIDRFNSDERKLRATLAGARDRSREYIAPAKIRQTLDADERELIERFVVADTLAVHYGRRSLAALVGIIAGVFVAVLVFEIYGHLLPNKHWLLAGYLTALIVAWLVQRVARAGEYQARYLDYRALAEGLRVQLFWWIAGLQEDVADHYMRKQRSVLDWIRDAIRIWSIGGEARAVGNMDLDALDSFDLQAEAARARLGIVIEHWVADQAEYFSRAAHRLHRRLHRVERIVDILFGGAILMALGILLAHAMLGDTLYIGHAPILAIGVLLLIAGVLHGFVGKRAYPELQKQFARMSGVFSYAHRRLLELRDTDDADASKALLMELGVEALAENGDWIVLHRERPVEMPKGH